MKIQCLLASWTAAGLVKAFTLVPPVPSGTPQPGKTKSPARLDRTEVPIWTPKPAEVVTHSLTKVFSKDLFFAQNRERALDDVSISVSCAGPIALIGDAGSGKTTFLKILAGKESPSSGTVDITGDHRMVYLTRHFAHDPRHTVAANVRARIARAAPAQHAEAVAEIADRLLRMVELGAKAAGKAQPAQHAEAVVEIADRVLRMAESGAKAATKAQDLSGGEVLRFGLAMALAAGVAGPEPPVLLCDEFLDHEDQRVRVRVEGVMRRLLNVHGVGILFSSHSMNTVLELSDAAIVFSNGQVIQMRIAALLLTVTASYMPLDAFQAGPTAEIAYIRTRLERRVRRVQRARAASEIMARTLDNLVHLRAPAANAPPPNTVAN
ncbi:P-loop containing nucleoside triphosphate hydrolase protein [Tribonema minus]|uniref:P-loop containing nucleoside triphosphate hydrolase protein n=1 Tax=Tribonema minus TaxID=303371 RepID=A0A836CP28_9STRA|nr:P-loop containing nucleoside triphosphate hydrolase protein [Tribonema minus]